MLVGLDRKQFGDLTALNHFRQVFLHCFPNMLLSIKSKHQRRSFNTITEDIKDIVTAGPTVFTWAPIFACRTVKEGSVCPGVTLLDVRTYKFKTSPEDEGYSRGKR